MKYRIRLETVSNILRTSVGGANETRLMRGTRLPFEQLNAYLDLLLTRGLISREEQTHAYSITDKGSRLLAVSDEVHQIISM